jgi:HPr kinase/phosphorylase
LPADNRIHGTLVARQGQGVLLRGASGSGKSDLALRLLSPPWTWQLVADDQVLLARENGTIAGSAPATLAGLLEVRGVGIVPVPHLASAPIRLVIDLVPFADVERLPGASVTEVLGVKISNFRLTSFAVSTPEKLELLLRQVLSP